MRKPTRRTTALASMAVGLALVGAACSSSPTTSTSSTTAPATSSPGSTAATKPSGATPGTMAKAEKNIVETAVAAGSFKTLATLLTEAGLVETLQGPGPFTVFAPTDEAFAKVPAATLEALQKDPAKLKEVLTYHVIKGEVMAKDVKPGTVETVAGKPLTIKVEDGKVMVGDATVVKTDITASNGVIHVIDAVLIPPAS